MSGHTGAIVQLTFNTSGDTIYTASVDKTVGMWDSMTGERIKRMKGHTSFVNSVDCARNDRPLVVSGGDDCQIRVWDTRRRQAVTTLNNNYQVREHALWKTRRYQVDIHLGAKIITFWRFCVFMSRLGEILTFRNTYLSYLSLKMASEDLRNTLKGLHRTCG